MNTRQTNPGKEIDTGHNGIKPVNFYCSAPGAGTVQLAGAFNRWRPILMEQREEGWWYVQIWLPHGHHQYRFLVDGKPMLDKRATGTVLDADEEPVSLVAVC
ncbi:MAG TPA: glycogen-binding domain-containing protein [Candidatus Acidoferrum sp.]|nr:glycogen-binding domain-containing protein [Candidatus Acidoferrum sp.]